MKTRLLFLGTILCAKFSFSTNYYVASTGNNSNTGLSKAQAWVSLVRVSQQNFLPGDTVFFEAGKEFAGSLYLDESDAGTATKPVVFTSTGSTKAIFKAGTSYGVFVYNSAGYVFRNLDIRGSGISTNKGHGFQFYSIVDKQLEYLKIDSCEISGFREGGLLLGSWETLSGYSNVSITNCRVYENGRAGIVSYAWNSLYSHRNIYIGFCEVFNNRGLEDITTIHTGSGIALSGIDTAMIEYCEAYNNGENSNWSHGGPVGIWYYLVRNGIIQHCESHHNKTRTNDGGGFDLDGGCQNSIIQYCYSHDNYGAGYLLAEYGSGATFTDNIIRYNISQNDGLKNNFGGITVWGASATARITNTDIHNNTVYTSKTGLVSGVPSALRFLDNNFYNVAIRNNIFYAAQGTNLVLANKAADSNVAHMMQNNYYSTASPSFKWNGSTFSSLDSWKTAAPTQEKSGTNDYGKSTDPLLNGPGSGATVGIKALKAMPSMLTGYYLADESVLIDAGIPNEENPATDFFRNPSISGPANDIGAFEYANSILPKSLMYFTAKNIENTMYVSWDSRGSFEFYDLQMSTDGKTYTTLRKENYREGKIEFIQPFASELVYLRLCLIKNEEKLYSKVLVLRRNDFSRIQLQKGSGGNLSMQVKSEAKKNGIVAVYDYFGRSIIRKAVNLEPGINSLDITMPGSAKGRFFLVLDNYQPLSFYY